MVNRATIFQQFMLGPINRDKPCSIFFWYVRCGCLCFQKVFKDIANPGLENRREIPDTRTNILKCSHVFIILTTQMKGAVYSSIIILLQTEGCKVTFFYDYDELFRQTDL